MAIQRLYAVASDGVERSAAPPGPAGEGTDHRGLRCLTSSVGRRSPASPSWEADVAGRAEMDLRLCGMTISAWSCTLRQALFGVRRGHRTTRACAYLRSRHPPMSMGGCPVRWSSGSGPATGRRCGTAPAPRPVGAAVVVLDEDERLRHGSAFRRTARPDGDGTEAPARPAGPYVAAMDMAGIVLGWLDTAGGVVGTVVTDRLARARGKERRDRAKGTPAGADRDTWSC